MKISKEIKTAIIVISGVVLFVLGINFLMSKSLFDNNRHYYAIFDHSGGLTPSTPVTVNGKQIGKVTDVTLRQSDAKIKVNFEIDSEFKFSKNSKAELYKSLLGNAGIQIIPALDGAENLDSGEISTTVQPDMLTSITNELDPLKAKLEQALHSVDSLVTNLNSLLDEERKESLKISIDNLSAITSNFRNITSNFNEMVEDNKGKLTNSMTNVETITTNLASVTDTISKADIAGSLAEFNSAMVKLDGIMTGIENGEGNAGKLLKDEQLYQNLEGASRQLEQLLQDLKLNPKRYVHFSLFGKKNKDYQPPADEEK
ncbi:phospholipid/cholesterol/gamma-HCH transport system substrate-binding protein [Pustulibacterium marinum]|uniref:Phospholipid/cholesterol/gamma-HCH transport system substrate-binding protein n=1 Tax=Pustulibacterium marinum TaxID=1224947 RepID=A0A1I7HWZ4_9FLAO|nr:MlaD family protein [Pustulibacterium marinum]SFU65200.1 phospholipid/cholesterol/gamma-HCH transport system substrate-binding protein [Pustulibacterium marinum]